MYTKKMLDEAKSIRSELISYRRAIHSFAEVGFDTHKTIDFIKNELDLIGVECRDFGRCGLAAEIGNKKGGKVILLRADIDALPIKEESGEEFSSDNGNMHACGHDMHAAMLLGAARLLKNHENEINGRIKLMFQPAEELLKGADDMIQAGVLSDPHVDAAMMIHVMAGIPLASGTVIVSSEGESAPAADYFTVTVKGKGCHGAMPNMGVDPITAAAHIIISAGEILSREISMNDRAALTFGSIKAGDGANVIPDVAVLRGSMRAFGESEREFIKKRFCGISAAVGLAFRTEVDVTFDAGCPPLKNDGEIASFAEGYLKELLGREKVFMSKELEGGGKRVAGSEDFAYISQKVPSLMIAVAAGSPTEGYGYPLHHPKVRFNESALPIGAAVYAYTAMRWLCEKST